MKTIGFSDKSYTFKQKEFLEKSFPCYQIKDTETISIWSSSYFYLFLPLDYSSGSKSQILKEK